MTDDWTDDKALAESMTPERERMTNPTPAKIINDTVWAGRRLNAGHQVVEALKAAGYAIVPKEPTDAMLEAGAATGLSGQRFGTITVGAKDDCRDIWRAMLNTKDTGS